MASNVVGIEDIASLPPGLSGSEKINSSDSEKNSSLAKDVESSAASVDEVSEDGEVLSDVRDLITHVISVDDDPSLNPWTFRTLAIGLGLSTFGGVLGTNIFLHPVA